MFQPWLPRAFCLFFFCTLSTAQALHCPNPDCENGILEGDEENRIVCNKCKQVVELQDFYSSVFNYYPDYLQSSGSGSGSAAATLPLRVPASVKTTHWQGLDANNYLLMKRIGLTDKNGKRFFTDRQITNTFATLKQRYPYISLNSKITNTCMTLAWTELLIAKMFNNPYAHEETDTSDTQLTAQEKIELYTLIAYWIQRLYGLNRSTVNSKTQPAYTSRPQPWNAATLTQNFVGQMQSTTASTLHSHETVADFFYDSASGQSTYSHGMTKLESLSAGEVLILNHNSAPSGLITILSVQGQGYYIIIFGNYYMIANNTADALEYLHAIADYSLLLNLPGVAWSYLTGVAISSPIAALIAYFGNLSLAGTMSHFFGLGAVASGRGRIINDLDEHDAEENNRDKES